MGATPMPMEQFWLQQRFMAKPKAVYRLPSKCNHFTYCGIELILEFVEMLNLP